MPKTFAKILRTNFHSSLFHEYVEPSNYFAASIIPSLVKQDNTSIRIFTNAYRSYIFARTGDFPS
ncbi:2638_t:CDS:2 [Acaulospora morrowiae]|uniref:2638_t:CDS:1 n=1 Tax=Acaulospora morrowiae TaxID=94023 RepID=A0A9N9GV09_9GLOM|nr:2638_t:CDS:2 [Acaulospora morrowiae]